MTQQSEAKVRQALLELTEAYVVETSDAKLELANQRDVWGGSGFDGKRMPKGEHGDRSYLRVNAHAMYNGSFEAFAQMVQSVIDAAQINPSAEASSLEQLAEPLLEQQDVGRIILQIRPSGESRIYWGQNCPERVYDVPDSRAMN